MQYNIQNDAITLTTLKYSAVDLYSAFIEVTYTQGAQVRMHCVTCKLHRSCLYLVSIHQMRTYRDP